MAAGGVDSHEQRPTDALAPGTAPAVRFGCCGVRGPLVWMAGHVVVEIVRLDDWLQRRNPDYRDGESMRGLKVTARICWACSSWADPFDVQFPILVVADENLAATGFKHESRLVQ